MRNSSPAVDRTVQEPSKGTFTAVTEHKGITINSNIKVADVATTPIDTLKSLWCSNFHNLTTTIVAISRDRSTPEITTTLYTPQWIPRALDAAWHVQGELAVAAERFQISKDGRLGRARADYVRVRKLRAALQRSHEVHESKLNCERFTHTGDTATHLAERLMVRLFPQEMAALQEQVAHSYALPRDSPWRHEGRDIRSAIEQAIELGMIPVEPNSVYHRLRGLPLESFLRLVQDDARDQNKRLAELRDLRLFAQWGYALSHLLGRIGPQAHADPVSRHLRNVDYKVMPYKKAEATLRARRAYLSIWQRYQEHLALQGEKNRLVEQLRVQFSDQWVQISLQARKILIERNPEAYGFILEKANEHTTDGSKLDPRLMEDAQYRGQISREIRELARDAFGLQARPLSAPVGRDRR